eukprot:jgi/Undpi1/12991/HiC_scaffold_7.g02655.m1
MAPFPYMPMTAIMVGLVSQQVVQMSIFAYAGFMVEFLGAVDDTDKAGFYTGLLSSGFVIGRIFSAHFWGLVADRHGSRSVLLWGLVGTAVLSIAFGFSRTFEYALACRLLLGLVNGMMTASKSLVSQVCGPEHDTVGMGLLTSAWSIGAVLGPGVGGILTEPAINFPGTFSEDGVFGKNPYLLPNLVGAGLSIVALPLALLFLKDSKGAGIGNATEQNEAWYSSCRRFCDRFFRRSRNSNANTGINGNSSLNKNGGRGEDHLEGASFHIEDDTDEVEGYGIRKPSWMLPDTTPIPTATRENGNGSSHDDADRISRKTEDLKPESLLKQRHVVALLFMEAVYSMTYSGFDEVYALWALSSASKGGLEWTSHQIGQVFLACGMFVLLFELVAVPYLTPWLGVKLSQRLGSVFEMPVYICFPFVSRIGGGDVCVTLTTFILLFTFFVCSNSFYVGTALAINTSTPGRLGEVNGISSAISSVARATSPILSASVFAWSINANHGFPFNHYLTFYLLGAMRLTAACLGWNRITDNGNME